MIGCCINNGYFADRLQSAYISTFNFTCEIRSVMTTSHPVKSNLSAASLDRSSSILVVDN